MIVRKATVLAGLLASSACNFVPLLALRIGADAGASNLTVPETDAAVSSDGDGTAITSPWLQAPLFESGSRLRARLRDGGDGALRAVGLHDSALGADCTFALAEDGVRRCLPLEAPGAVYYTDTDCTQPVYAAALAWQSGTCQTTSSSTFAYDLLRPSARCGEEFLLRMYRVGAPLPSAPVYYASAEGCAPLTAADCLHALEPMPAEAFVPGENHTRPADHGIALAWAEYADGARMVEHVRDMARNADCQPDPELAGDHCVPIEQAHEFEPQFTRSDCTGTPVAVDFSRARPCMPAQIAVTSERTACGTFRRSAFELGATLDALYVADGAQCTQREPIANEVYYRIGPALDGASLPALRNAFVGSARLALRYYESQDGTPLMAAGAAGYLDRTLRRSCNAERFLDGQLRCMPTNADGSAPLAAFAHGPFADPGCTALLIENVSQPDACLRNADIARVLAPPALTPQSARRVGEQLKRPATVYYLDDGSCTPRPSAGDATYYALVEELELAPIAERVE